MEEEKNTAENEVPKLKKIIFALPGDNFSSKFLIAWTATISKLWICVNMI